MSGVELGGGSVDVRFCLDADDDCIDERELTENFDEYRPRMQAKKRFSGAIVITAPGQPTVEYEDELGPAVQDLCFRSVPDLLAGKAVDLTTFSYPGSVSVVPDGDVVIISGDVVETAKVPLRPLARGLVACGQRFITFARRLRGQEYEHILKPLEDLGRSAAAALE